jgi:hypothetical protein
MLAGAVSRVAPILSAQWVMAAQSGAYETMEEQCTN